MKELRCPKCNKKLALLKAEVYELELFCWRCDRKVLFATEPSQTAQMILGTLK